MLEYKRQECDVSLPEKRLFGLRHVTSSRVRRGITLPQGQNPGKQTTSAAVESFIKSPARSALALLPSIMGTPGDDPKEPDRPSWQHTSEEPSQQSDQHSKSPARESLLEKARKFVLEDPVRDATTDKKIAFLEEKGLTNEEIQELLGISRNSSAPDLGESSFDDSKVGFSIQRLAPLCRVILTVPNIDYTTII